MNDRLGFDTYTEASASYRGDNRTSSSDGSWYSWDSQFGITARTVEYHVHLNSQAFTNPSADYNIGTQGGTTGLVQVNQNTAKAGWSYIGSHYISTTTPLWIKVNADSGSTTGADGVMFRY